MAGAFSDRSGNAPAELSLPVLLTRRLRIVLLLLVVGCANGIVRIPWGFLFSSVITLGTGFTQLAADQTFGVNPQFERQYIFEPPTRPFLGVGNVFATQNMDLRLAKDFDVAVRTTRWAGD